jgi:hypothetical protein
LYSGGWLIAERVLHDDDGQPDQTKRIALCRRERRKLLGRDEGRGNSTLLELDGVVATPRRAGPSVAYRDDGHRTHPADLVQAVTAKWDARGRLRFANDSEIAKLEPDQRLKRIVEGRDVRFAVAH